jgi:hypothetical protein
MFGESFVVESRRVRSAMCGGSMTQTSMKRVTSRALSYLRNITVSFEVVPLFANVPISGVMSLLSGHFENILRLFRHVLTSNLSCGSQFY